MFGYIISGLVFLSTVVCISPLGTEVYQYLCLIYDLKYFYKQMLARITKVLSSATSDYHLSVCIAMVLFENSVALINLSVTAHQLEDALPVI